MVASVKDQSLVCAVCARVLTDHPLLGWVHGLQDSPADHPSIPATRDEIHTRSRCDFCNVEDPVWVVPVASFVALPGHGSDGDWAACDTCVAFVRTDDWPGLARHAALRLSTPERKADPAALRHIYQELRANLRGKPTRIP